MKLLELRADGPEPLVVTLHPRVAVVRADSELRARLVAALDVALRGGDRTVTGVLEAAGVRIDLEAALGDSGRFPRPEAPIRPEDLPGVGAVVSEPARRRRASAAEVARLRDELTAARAQAADAVAAVHELERLLAATRSDLELTRRRVAEGGGIDAALEAARQAEEDASAAAGLAHADHEDAVAILEELDRQVAQARRVVDSRLAELDAQLAQRARLRTLLDPPRVTPPAVPLPPAPSAIGSEQLAAARQALAVAGEERRRLEAELDEIEAALHSPLARVDVPGLRARQEALHAELATLDVTDPGEVADALSAYVQARTAASLPVHASELLSAWQGQQVLVERMRAERQGPDPVALAAARERLEEARELLAAAERAAPPVLDPEQRRRIEDAHEAVLQAEERAERRFAGAAARQRLAEAKRAEDELLASFGLTSFSDYLLSTTIAGPDPAQEMRAEAARRQVAAAEAELAVLEGGSSGERALRQAEEDLAELRRRIVEECGCEPEILAFQLRTEADIAERRTLLEAALLRVGVVPDTAPIEDVAAAWIDERRRHQHRQAAITAELAEIAADLLTAEGADGGPATGSPAELAARRAELTRHLAVARERELASERVLQRLEAAASAPVPTQTTPPPPPPPPPSGPPAEADRAAMRVELAGVAAQVEATKGLVAAAQTELADAEHRVAAARQRVTETAAQVRAADEALQAATAHRVAIEQQASTRPSAAEVAVLGERLGELELRLVKATGAEVAARQAVGAAQVRLEAAEAELRRAEELERLAVATGGSSAPVHEIEFFLLARVSAQRALAAVAPAPLVLDDALVALPQRDRARLLGRLESLADTVQVIYLTDDPFVVDWARQLRPEQGALADLAVALV